MYDYDTAADDVFQTRAAQPSNGSRQAAQWCHLA
jgi:hypothetical protein